MDPVAIITDALADFGPDMGLIAVAGLGVGASLYALKKGWSLFRSFGK